MNTLIRFSWTFEASAGLKCLARIVEAICHTLPCVLLLVPAPDAPVFSPDGRITRFSFASGPIE